jgi:hypothetical protein
MGLMQSSCRSWPFAGTPATTAATTSMVSTSKQADGVRKWLGSDAPAWLNMPRAAEPQRAAQHPQPLSGPLLSRRRPSTSGAAERPASTAAQDFVAAEPTLRPGTAATQGEWNHDWSDFDKLAHVASMGGLKMPEEETALAFLHQVLSESRLPVGWRVAKDQFGRVYFANMLSSKSSWTHPLAPQMKELADVFRMCSGSKDFPDVRDLAVSTLLATWQDEAQVALEPWVPFTDVNDLPCFQNRETGEFTYLDPAETILPPLYLKIASLQKLRAADYQVSADHVENIVDQWHQQATKLRNERLRDEARRELQQSARMQKELQYVRYMRQKQQDQEQQEQQQVQQLRATWDQLQQQQLFVSAEAAAGAAGAAADPAAAGVAAQQEGQQQQLLLAAMFPGAAAQREDQQQQAEKAQSPSSAGLARAAANRARAEA